MGRFSIGKEEDLRCIVDVDITGAHGEALCLAYKTTKLHVGAPAYLHDDGYVLRARTADQYYDLDAAKIVAYQKTGALPDPLPTYVIPTSEYVYGYSLWLVIAVMIGAYAVQRYLRVRRYRREQRHLTVDASPAGRPLLLTEADTFIDEAVAPLLRPEERVLHQAYVVDRNIDSAGMFGALFARGLFAVVTTQRVILVSTRVGVLGPSLQNLGVESFERSAIVDFRLDGDALVLDLAGGAIVHLVLCANAPAFSNQRTFARDVIQTLAAG